MHARAMPLAACTLFSALAQAQTPSFHLVGVPPGNSTISYVYGLSADGSKAAGMGLNSTALVAPGFTWTAASGRDDFGLLPGMPLRTAAYAISGDGSTVAGDTATGTYESSRAFRRVGEGPVEDLGLFSSYTRAFGLGVSGDGSVVVGRAERGSGFGQAFRWTSQGGMQGLGFVGGSGIWSQADGISRDGSTIVGTSQDAAGNSHAFSWTAAVGMQELSRLPNARFIQAAAHAVTPDGSIIVGESCAAVSDHAAIWRQGTVLDLGTIQDFATSIATAVTDDGSAVFGYAADSTTQPPLATFWSSSTRMLPLSDYLAANGVQIPSGWRLQYVLAASSDGTTLAGFATNGSQGQGFVATIPAPGALVPITLLALPSIRRRR